VEEYARLTLEKRLQSGRMPESEPSQNGLRAWSVLRSMAGTVEGPPDSSRELDHYLYGSPKRNESNE
jgi:hypothetical protein